jgi:hypothetical protein
MQNKKVFIREDDKAILICDRCGETLSVDCTQPSVGRSTRRVSCSCSAEYNVMCEKRRHYRKSVELFGGVYKIEGGNPIQERMFEIVIGDISRTGINFETKTDHDLKAGDYLRISFTLDDAKRSRVTLNLLVRRVSGQDVGAEITSREIPKSLAFYLLP